jgi:glycine oxidase
LQLLFPRDDAGPRSVVASLVYSGGVQPRVAVIGGGVIGLATSFQLARAGAPVVLIDPDPGKGATWAAAGMLAPASELTYVDKHHIEVNLAALEEFFALADALKENSVTDFGLARSGTLVVARTPDDLSYLEQLIELHREVGVASERLSVEQARRAEPHLSPALSGAALVSTEAQVDNRRLVSALLEAASSLGVEMVGDGVARAEADAEGVRKLILNQGATIEDFDVVVLAAGAYSATIPGLSDLGLPPVHPVKGQIMRLGATCFSPRTVVRAVSRLHPLYLVPRFDHVVVGGTVEDRGFDTQVTAGAVSELLREAIALAPGLEDSPILDVVARLRPGTPDNLPYVGRFFADNLILAYGHYRNGILQAALTARIVASLVLGTEPPACSRWLEPGRAKLHG